MGILLGYVAIATGDTIKISPPRSYIQLPKKVTNKKFQVLYKSN